MSKKSGYLVRPYIIILIVSIIMVLPQIMLKNPILGIDSNFHLNRIYEDAMQIKTGNFSYFQANYGFSQSGRIVNAMYGPIWGYVLGFILFATGSLVKFQIVSDLLLLVVGGSGMYLFTRKSGANELFATIGTILYMNVGWFVAWLTGQEFTAWGMMVMPYVLIMGIRMITDHDQPVRVLPLAVSVAVIIQVHMLSTLLIIIALIPYFIVGMQRANDRVKMLQKTVLAAVLTIIMSANVWAGMLNVTSGNHLMQPFTVANMDNVSLNLSIGDNYLFALGTVCSILFVCQIFAALSTKGLQLATYLNTFVGAFFLIIGSKLFPWQRLATVLPAAKNWLQFPSRLGSIAGILLIAGAAGYLTTRVKATQNSHHQVGTSTFLNWPTGLFAFAALMLVWQNVTVMNGQLKKWDTAQPIQRMDNIYLSNHATAAEIRAGFKGKDLSKGLALAAKGTTDYLNQPASDVKYNQNRNTYTDYINQIVKKNHLYNKKVLADGSLSVTWQAKRRGKTQLPVVGYAKSAVTFNGTKGWNSQYQHSNLGALIVDQKPGKNTLIIKYHPGKTFTLLSLAALISWLAVLVLWVVQGIRQRKQPLSA